MTFCLIFTHALISISIIYYRKPEIELVSKKKNTERKNCWNMQDSPESAHSATILNTFVQGSFCPIILYPEAVI